MGGEEDPSSSCSRWAPCQIRTLIRYLQAPGGWGDNEQDWLRGESEFQGLPLPSPYISLLRIFQIQI